MADFAGLEGAAQAIDASVPAETAVAALVEHVPDSCVLADLSDLLRETTASQSIHDTRAQLLVLAACLRALRDRRAEHDVQPAGEEETAAVQALASRVAQRVAPVDVPRPKTGSNKTADQDDAAACHARVAQRCRALAGPGLVALASLASDFRTTLPDPVLLVLAAFADDPAFDDDDGDDDDEWWSQCTEARIPARRALAAQFSGTTDTDTDTDTTTGKSPGRDRERFMAETALRGYLRGLFAQTPRPVTVTATGRTAAFPEDAARARFGAGLPDDTRRTKPWKFADLGAVPVLGWVVGMADEHFIAQNWPLFTPPLLALADDATTTVRARGLVILRVFLAKFPRPLLRATGLAGVFERAVLPTLLFLPRLTPEAESVRLLARAYGALVCLARRLRRQEEGDHDGGRDASDVLLDRIMREGVVAGYAHAGDYVRVVRVLVEQAGVVVGEMGVRGVKHLKDLVPLFCTILTDPFAPRSGPAALLSAVRALQTTIANCWPRLSSSSQGAWHGEIVQALVMCWLNVVADDADADDKNDDDHKDRDSDSDGRARRKEIRQELARTAAMLAAVEKATGGAAQGMAERVAPLMAKEPALGGLFGF